MDEQDFVNNFLEGLYQTFMEFDDIKATSAIAAALLGYCLMTRPELVDGCKAILASLLEKEPTDATA